VVKCDAPRFGSAHHKFLRSACNGLTRGGRRFALQHLDYDSSVTECAYNNKHNAKIGRHLSVRRVTVVCEKGHSLGDHAEQSESNRRTEMDSMGFKHRNG
jgi:hypothetical protein